MNKVAVNFSQESNSLSYEFLTNDNKKVTFEIEDSDENPKFKIQGPKDFMQKLVGGLGENNETEAWVTEKELKTEAKRLYAIMEVMRAIK